MFKKILSLVLSFCLMLAVAVPGGAADDADSSSSGTPDPKTVNLTLNANDGKFDLDACKNDYPDFKYTDENTKSVQLDGNGKASCGLLPKDTHFVKRDGYTFVGWYTTKDTSGTQFTDNQSFQADTILYAVWNPIEYTVKLDADKGTFSNGKATDEVTLAYGKAYSELPEPKRDGYAFKGWLDADSSDAPVDANTKASEKSPKNLKAEWTANTYTVSFNYNYPTGDYVFTPSPAPAAPKSQTVTYAQTYGDLPTLDSKNYPAGYKFTHWTTTMEDKAENIIVGGSDPNSSTTVSTASDHTLYAQWEKEKDVFIVAFNYGSTLTTPQDATKYLVYTTPKPTAGTGGGGTSSSPDTATGSPSTTSTATPTPTPKEGDAYYGQQELPAPKINGYEFLGWAKNATKDGNDMVVPSAEPTVKPWDSVTNDHTLYAKWQPAKHTITFNLNYSPAPSPNPYPSKEAEHNTRVITLLPTSNPTRSGYRFAGWTAGGKLVDNNTRLEQDMIVYASWVEANSVKLEVNGGTLPANTSDTILVTSTGTENVWPSLPQPTRSGYDFLGWYTENTGGDRITSGMEVSGEIPLRLYARWTAKQYTVKFDYNGTTGSTDPKKYTYGEKYLNLPTNATWPGHTFMGWYTAASGGTRVVGGETTVTTAADHTLYAHWGFKISFEPGTGFGEMEDAIAPLGEDYALPECKFTAPDGMSFYRWAVGTARGEQVSAGTRVPVSRNTTLYAIWKESPVEIVVSSTSGGSLVSSEGSSGDTIAMERGSSITFTARPSRGYQVAELVVDGERCPGLDRYTFTDLQENHTIHAVFEIIPDPGYTTCDHNYTCPLRRFRDLDPNAWYHDAVHYCLDQVFMNGVDTNRYSPNTRATRAMLVTVLWQAAGCPYTPSSGAPGNPFNDVTPQDWFYKQVCWAKEEKIIGGYSNGDFGPNDPITREQLVTILWQYANRPGHSENRLPFYDSWAVSNYAWDPMLWATESNIIGGTGNNTLNPKGYATRAQVAQFTLAFMRYTGRL